MFKRLLPIRVIFLFISCLAVFSYNTDSARADDPSSREFVIGGLIYKFTKFVAWPHNFEAKTKFTMCFRTEYDFARVYSPDKKTYFNYFDSMLASRITPLNYKIEGGLPVAIITHAKDTDIPNCDLLFASHIKDSEFQRIMALTAGKPIFTIGETEDFAEDGGIMELFTVPTKEGKLKYRFKINKKSADASKISMSSDLYKLASEVYK